MPNKSRDNNLAKHVSGGRPSWLRGHLRQIILFSLLVIAVAAVGLAGWGVYNSKIKPYNQAVVKFNDATFNMRYYINTLKNYYGIMPSSALADYSSYGDTEIEQLAGYVETKIGQDYIIKQGSLALGVQIEPGDIRAQLRNSGDPVTRERIDSLMAQQLVKKQVPANQPQVHAQAMLLESESAAQAAKARLEASETFDQVAAEISKLTIDDVTNGDLGWTTAREINLKVGSTKFGDLVFGAGAAVLSGPAHDDTVLKKYGYWVMKVVEKTEATDSIDAKVHIQGILVGSEEEAKAVKDKLNGGADIDALAKELSQQPGAKDNGAELGWASQILPTEDPDSPFNMPVNTLYGPVSDSQSKTKGGFWIFNVLEKNDNLALTDNQQLLLEKDLFDRFNAELQKNPKYKVENLLTPELTNFALNNVVDSLGPGSVIIDTGSLPDGDAGESYSYQLGVYGTNKGNTWSVESGSLTDGISLDKSTGMISGKPLNAGLSSFTIEVNNGLHFWKQNLTIRLHFPVSISTGSLPEGQAGNEYSALLEVLGESDSYSWSLATGSLPDGLNLDENTGEIYGTPSTAGTSNFTVQVDDGRKKATRTLSLTVQ